MVAAAAGCGGGGEGTLHDGAACCTCNSRTGGTSQRPADGGDNSKPHSVTYTYNPLKES
jgi:hypothetical protein